MDDSTFDIDQLKDYLQGRLDSEESAAFEERMEQDRAFRKEVNIHKAILAGMDQHFDKRLKDLLVRQDQASSGILHRGSWVQWTAIAASLLLAISVAFLLFRSREANHQEIFEQYYRPYQNIISETDRGERDTLIDDYKEAFRKYEAQDYREAVNALNRLRTQDPEDSAVNFYLGLSLLAINKNQEAIRLLEVLAKEDHPLNEPASWYLGLTYLKAGEKAKAKAVFVRIKTDGSSYTNRAEKILDELD